MSSWRDAILGEFVPQVSKLTLVADPDGLLGEETLALSLRARGFDLIEFNDAVAFRYAYESNYRVLWDRGERTDLVVILRLQNADLSALPYDLLQVGRRLSFNLGDLFPSLSYPVLEQLDPSLFDAIYDAQQKVQPERLGDNATQDFILHHVFGIAAELIVDDVDLLRALLRLHYNQIQMPRLLSGRLIHLLAQGAGRPSSALSPDWPLAAIIPDAQAFFAFLQERWPLFVERLPRHDDASLLHEGDEACLAYPGPALLPFDHQEIRIYIDNLFVEGRLTPIRAASLRAEKTAWVRSGILENAAEDERIRLARLFDLLGAASPQAAWKRSDWLSFAQKWAELSALVHTRGAAAERQRLNEMGATVNTAFSVWLATHYAGLINLSPSTPTMLHHVSRRLARDLEESPQSRVALVVVDGLALDQWVTLRPILEAQMAQHPHLGGGPTLREGAVFAWVPTLTAVSRQAAFAGKIPHYFPSSIGHTNKEESLWQQFWDEAGVGRSQVVYSRGLGDGNAGQTLDALVRPGQSRVVGLVVDKVDKISHGMQLGAAGMHNQIRQWAEGGYLADLLAYLLRHNYSVWLTSDHGNVECVGRGRPAEGVIAETRGERVRVYPTPELRAGVAVNFPHAQIWQPVGLPPGYFPLLAAGDAFVNAGENLVSHGGATIEEVIVPLIQFQSGAQPR
jgi:hypothetical protein